MTDGNGPGGAGRANGAGSGAGTGRFPSVAELIADDWFLGHLGSGNANASGAGPYGTDAHIAGLFVAAREEVRADVPPIDVEAVLDRVGESDADRRTDVVDVEALPADDAEPVGAATVNGVDEVDGPVSATGVNGAAGSAGESDNADSDTAGGESVAGAPVGRPLVGKRHRGPVTPGPRRWWYPSRTSSALIGAAASFLVVVGGLGAVHSAGPESALWPVKQSLFGTGTAEVELASMLEEADAASAAGDVERAQQLLERAQQLLDQVEAIDREALQQRMRESEQRVRTITETPDATTVTEGRTETRVRTETHVPEPVTRTPDPVTRTETVTETVTRTTTLPPADGGGGGTGGGGTGGGGGGGTDPVPLAGQGGAPGAAEAANAVGGAGSSERDAGATETLDADSVGGY